VLAVISQVLVCPNCRAALLREGAALRCVQGHSFDIAREGYVNLLPGGAGSSTADTPEMVSARRAFLSAGHFEAVATAVARAARAAAADDVPGVVLDAGAGTGYVVGTVLDALPLRPGLALDLSKHAVRVAARSHDRLGAVVADVWQSWPVRDRACALVLNVFAPRNAAEFGRVLDPRGALIVVTPESDHLVEIVGPLGLLSVDPHKEERLSASLDGLFERVDSDVVSYPISLDGAGVVAAALMGPSAAHLSADEIETRCESLRVPVTVTVAVTVGTYRPRARSVVSP